MLIRLATRGSPLALAQSGMVADDLRAAGAARGIDVDVELVRVSTDGDRMRGPIPSAPSTGVFVAAVRAAVAAGDCDVAVHSLKDVPTAPHGQVEIAAIPVREDARDALCTPHGSLAGLPAGARVGTGSPRRAAQLLVARPDLDVVPVRGNVDTRLAKATGAELDAVVLAVAGLNRLGLASSIAEAIDPAVVVPAPGQGALAIDVARGASADLRELVAALDDPATRAAVTAERAALARLEAGCSAPMGAYATGTGATLTLHVRVASGDGARLLEVTLDGAAADASGLGTEAADQLLDRGAAALVEASS